MRVLSGGLSYSIRYDVEHDLFHAQNVFNDEYIKPTFVEYVQKIETENAYLKTGLSVVNASNSFNKEQLTKAKEIIKKLSCAYKYVIRFEEYADKEVLTEAEQFLKED